MMQKIQMTLTAFESCFLEASSTDFVECNIIIFSNFYISNQVFIFIFA